MKKGKPLVGTDEEKRNTRIYNLVTNRGKAAPVTTAMEYKLAYYDILSKGYNHAEAVRKFMEKFPEMSDSQAERWRQKALAEIKKAFEDRADTFRAQQIHRLEGILQQALDSHDLKNALKAVDIMNKTVGFYRDNEPQAAVQVTFQFGDSPQPQQIITVTPVENDDMSVEEADNEEDNA